MAPNKVKNSFGFCTLLQSNTRDIVNMECTAHNKAMNYAACGELEFELGYGFTDTVHGYRLPEYRKFLFDGDQDAGGSAHSGSGQRMPMQRTDVPNFTEFPSRRDTA